MTKVRLTLLAALLVAIVAGGALLKGFAELHSWIRWISLGGSVFSGIWMLAVITVLGMSFFTTTGDDLWSSWYFRKMRKRWGDDWGGPSVMTDPNTGEERARRLQISTCRAVLLSALTFLRFLMMGIAVTAVVAIYIGMAVFPMYFGGAGALYGFDHPSNFFHFKGESVMWLGLTAQLVLVVLLGMLVSVLPRRLRAIPWKIGIPIFGVNAILLLFIVPMKTFGTVPVLKWEGIVIGIVVGVILALVLLVLFIIGVVKMSKKLSRETVSGVLLLGQLSAWKQRACPLIIQGEKTPQLQL